MAKPQTSSFSTLLCCLQNISLSCSNLEIVFDCLPTRTEAALAQRQDTETIQTDGQAVPDSLSLSNHSLHLENKAGMDHNS